MHNSVAIPISDSSQVGEARRAAAQVARDAGLGETEAGKIAIIATELANNLQKYAQGGRILLQAFPGPAGIVVEVVSIDNGPGMSDVYRCQEDGFSTGGTPGSGLGAVKRLATEFDIFSSLPKGTVVLARVYANGDAKIDQSEFVWALFACPPRAKRCVETPGESQSAREAPRLSSLMDWGMGRWPARHPRERRRHSNSIPSMDHRTSWKMPTSGSAAPAAQPWQ